MTEGLPTHIEKLWVEREREFQVPASKERTSITFLLFLNSGCPYHSS